MIKKTKSKSGFTLIELVVSLAIISIILFIATDTTVRLIRQAEKADIRAEISRNVNYAVETIKRNVIQSSSTSLTSCTNPSNSTSTTDCISVNSSKMFYLKTDTSAKTSKIFFVDGGSCTVLTPCDITGSMLYISNLLFTFSDKFLEIKITTYDSNQIVYTQSNPFVIVTGALIRN